MPQPGKKLKAADRYWEIQLAWSEFQHGRWTAKNLSEPVTFAAYRGDDNILFGGYSPEALTRAGGIAMKPTGDLPPREDDEGPHVGPGGVIWVPPNATLSIVPRHLVSKEMITFKAFPDGEVLVVRGYLRRDYRVPITSGAPVLRMVMAPMTGGLPPR
jgi:hypothetical protein